VLKMQRCREREREREISCVMPPKLGNGFT